MLVFVFYHELMMYVEIFWGIWFRIKPDPLNCTNQCQTERFMNASAEPITEGTHQSKNFPKFYTLYVTGRNGFDSLFLYDLNINFFSI